MGAAIAGGRRLARPLVPLFGRARLLCEQAQHAVAPAGNRLLRGALDRGDLYLNDRLAYVANIGARDAKPWRTAMPR
jgi:hypothetical protein